GNDLSSISPSGNTESSDEMVETTVSEEHLSDFDLETLDGARLTEADLRDQVHFVRFSSSTCHICERENPSIAELENDDSFIGRFIDINIAEPRDVVQAYKDRSGIDHPIVLDIEGALTVASGVFYTPTHNTLSPDGTVCQSGAGFMDKEEFRELSVSCAS
ncbi:MAG: TlpA family protein disulfide reductase, partial [Candidatus Paceibacterota bacterium]